MKNLTKVINDKNSIDLASKKKGAVALIASIFSVIFSLSIVLELQNIVSGVVLAFLIVFVVIFLVLNEKYKVDNIRKVYKGNKKALLAFSVTFIISLTLSSIGIYLWTNKSFNKKLENSQEAVSQELTIKNKYIDKISDIKSGSFSDTELAGELKESIDYWKSRRAANVDDRTYIRKQIEKNEARYIAARNEFNIKQQDDIVRINELMETELSKVDTMSNNTLKTIDFQSKISYIFLVMILITELGIIILNKEMAEVEIKMDRFVSSDMSRKYLLARKVLISLYLTKSTENVTAITHALYSSPVQKMNIPEDKKWNAVKNLYNLFINLGILDEGEVKKSKDKKSILVNKIMMAEEAALEIFDNYYDKLLSL